MVCRLTTCCGISIHVWDQIEGVKTLDDDFIRIPNQLTGA
jgi:hypothetical protein